jgi:predicted kinase
VVRLSPATLVLVGGRPGAGKSTLARRLAAALAWPLVSRDEIYQGIRHTLRHDPQRGAKDPVTEAAFGVFFQTIDGLVRAEVSVVAEAAFQDPRWRLGLRRITPAAGVRVVHCLVGPGRAAERVAERQGTAPRPAGAFVPVSLPVPSLSVDTADGYHPGFDAIVAFALGAAGDQ